MERVVKILHPSLLSQSTLWPHIIYTSSFSKYIQTPPPSSKSLITLQSAQSPGPNLNQVQLVIYGWSFADQVSLLQLLKYNSSNMKMNKRYKLTAQHTPTIQWSGKNMKISVDTPIQKGRKPENITVIDQSQFWNPVGTCHQFPD